MRELVLDWEVFSEVDLSTAGVYVYATDPTTEIMCLSITDEAGESYLWLPGTPVPQVILDVVASNDYTFHAFNAGFERLIWIHQAVKKHGFPKVPDAVWRCSAAKAAYSGYPRGLAKICKLLDLGEDGKWDEGHAAMLATCKIVRGKRNTDPELLQKVYVYCMRDTHSEKIVSEKCVPLPEIERAIWFVDMKINARGVPIDRELCEGAQYVIEDAFKVANQTCRDCTLLYNEDGTPQLNKKGEHESLITAPTQRDRIVDWCESRGVRLVKPEQKKANLQGPTVDYFLEEHDAGNVVLPDDVRSVLKARQDTQSAAVAKYSKALAQANIDDRCRDQHVYYKAVTGRWAAKGVQLQNLRHPSPGFKITEDAIDAIRSGAIENVRKFGDPIDVLASCVRAIPRAPQGRIFISADYAAIEARGLHWVAGDDETVQGFIDGVCLYSRMAAKIYQKDEAWAKWLQDNHDSDKDAKYYRNIGKSAVLGLGYRMGGAKFKLQTMIKSGVDLDLEFCDSVVQVYRNTFTHVTTLWRELVDACFMAHRTGKQISGGKWDFAMYKEWLTMRLPSGRRLFYFRPEVVESGRYGRPEMVYQGPSGRAYLSPSVLVENLVQSLARDILAHGLLNCEKRGLNVIAHVHDSVTVECDDTPEAIEYNKRQLTEALTDLPTWAHDLPMKADAEEAYTFA